LKIAFVFPHLSFEFKPLTSIGVELNMTTQTLSTDFRDALISAENFRFATESLFEEHASNQAECGRWSGFIRA
jgi:hypothetical protein